ncbi:MAG: flavodoxin family protein [Candidatus Odinarchaeia archaeon]
MRGIVVFESKYGNTRFVGEKIVEGIRSVKPVEFDFKTPKDVEPEDLAGYDVILFGSPNHIGRATRGMRKFIEKLSRVNLEGKKCAVFDTYLTNKHYLRAAGSMEKIIRGKVSGLEIVEPGLSVKVKGMKGPLEDDAEEKSFRFGEKIGSKI